MKRHVIYLWMVLILALSPGIAGEGPKAGAGSGRDLGRLRQEVQRLKGAYQTEYMKVGSDDYWILQAIGRAAGSEPEMVDALIDLCSIKETPPRMSGKFTLASITPAACELKKLGPLARRQVEVALASKHLTVWQKTALADVQHFLAQDEAEAKGLPPPPEYKAQFFSMFDFNNVAAKDAETLLTNPPEWLNYGPRLSKNKIDEDPQMYPPSPKPPKLLSPKQSVSVAATSSASSLRWGVAGAAVAALAVSVAWLIRKRRK